jgi:hypothetical protein
MWDRRKHVQSTTNKGEYIFGYETNIVSTIYLFQVVDRAGNELSRVKFVSTKFIEILPYAPGYILLCLV